MPTHAPGTIVRRDEPGALLLPRGASPLLSLADRLRRWIGQPCWEFHSSSDTFHLSPQAETLLDITSPAPRQRFLHAFEPRDRETIEHDLRRLESGAIEVMIARTRRNKPTSPPDAIEIRAVRLLDVESNDSLIIGYLSDPSKDHQLESQLLVGAFLDATTRLPNLALFEDLVSHALQRAPESAPIEITVLRVDRYDQIEAAFGSDFTHRWMTLIARRLEKHLDSCDTLARIGRELFAVLRESTCERYSSDRSIALSEVFASPFHVGDQTLYATVSVGIARGSHNDSAAWLIQNATAAALHSRSLGLGGQQHYAPEIRGKRQEFVRRETELREAIERGEISLEYQPIITLPDRRLAGFEALARWTNRSGQAVKPCDFIPLAEETGLIAPLGHWILEQAVQQLQRWSKFLPGDALQVSVNLSRRQLIGPDIVEQVRALLDRASVSPSRLCLEITESIMMQDVDGVKQVCRELRSMGVKIHIDDFGTGYSSLSTLPELPVDAIKLDRSFITPIAADPRSEQLVRGIIALAKSLDLAVTAEGIETSDQADLLRGMGCEKGQGYLFGRSMNGELAGRLFQGEWLE